MKRRPIIRLAAILAALAALVLWLWVHRAESDPPATSPAGPTEPTRSRTAATPASATGAERLLDGYGEPASPPVEDLRKLHRVAVGYFSVIKDATRFPIGGNEDLAAALRGENPNREVFVRPGHPVFLSDGRIGDRWGSPLIVHPVAWKQLELRSAGPDKTPYSDDDLVLDPEGFKTEAD